MCSLCFFFLNILSSTPQTSLKRQNSPSFSVNSNQLYYRWVKAHVGPYHELLCVFIILEQWILLDEFVSCVLATHYPGCCQIKKWTLPRLTLHILSWAELQTVWKQLCNVPCGSGGRGWETKSLVIAGANCFQPILTQTWTKQSVWDRRTEMIHSQS